MANNRTNDWRIPKGTSDSGAIFSPAIQGIVGNTGKHFQEGTAHVGKKEWN